MVSFEIGVRPFDTGLRTGQDHSYTLLLAHVKNHEIHARLTINQARHCNNELL
jgi:hypothetical protein